MGFVKPCFALPASTLETLRDALNGNASAVASLSADLGGGATTNTYTCAACPIAATYIVGDFNATSVLNALTAGGVSVAVVRQAIAGDTNALALIQTLVGGTQMLTPTTLYDFSLAPYSTMTETPLRHLNFIVSGHNAPTTPGIGSNSLYTLKLALGGDPAALSLLREILLSPLVPPGYIGTLTTSFLDAAAQTLGASNPVTAINNITLAQGNDGAAIVLVRAFAMSINSSAMGDFLDADALAFAGALDDFLPSTPARGVCGLAHNSVTLTMPTGSFLCSAGNASPVTGTGVFGTDPWVWTCEDASCTAATSSALAVLPVHTSATGVTSTGSSLSNPCGQLSIPLLGSFAFDPCTLAADLFGLSYAQNYYGGEQLANSIGNLWAEDFLPALKSETAQVDAGGYDQMRQLGSGMDAQTLTRNARKVQQQELQARRDYAPGELTCAAGSSLAPLGESNKHANNLKQGFKQDLRKRGSGAPGTAAETGPAAAQKEQWEEYCTFFHDPDTNNGVSACPDPETAGTVPNGDIGIEDFLLKDTINMQNPNEYKTAFALLRNLIQPKVNTKVPESAIKTPVGEEIILKQQHLDSVRNIAAEIVASIISRRASVPQSVFDFLTGIKVWKIRSRAGVPLGDIASYPSYNEVMQAMTKERFFDPEYFTRMQGNLSEIKQEQTALNAYIALQYQDIYKLQEQINALMAARAALKLNADPRPSRVEASPLR